MDRDHENEAVLFGLFHSGDTEKTSRLMQKSVLPNGHIDGRGVGEALKESGSVGTNGAVSKWRGGTGE